MDITGPPNEESEYGKRNCELVEGFSKIQDLQHTLLSLLIQAWTKPSGVDLTRCCSG